MINYFNFTKFKDKFLLTNDAGEYVFVDDDVFNKFLTNQELPENSYKKLIENHFVYDGNIEVFIEKYKNYVRGNKHYLYGGTSLHIFVLNNACNMSCIYCQAKEDGNMTARFMDETTAERCVDVALSSPGRYLTFEFQGGEPLLNFNVLKHIVDYTNEKRGNKQVEFNLVSNLTLLDNEKKEFLKEKRVNICTSLDGDKNVHDNNRPFASGTGTYDTVKEKIIELKENGLSVSAIQTTTKYSLQYPKEIINEYVEMGQNDLFIRPLTRLGTADAEWNEIGYSAEEFIDFYKKCLGYIIELNKKGIKIREKHAVLFLKKILGGFSENYMELRSPCGATIGQMAYFYDGNVFTCDEGRMFYEMGDDSFKIGNVEYNTYEEMVQSGTCKSVCVASLLEGQLNCCDCVYQPYCGVCPVINLAQENDIFSKKIGNYRCKVYKGMLESIFEILYINEKETIEILHRWIGA